MVSAASESSGVDTLLAEEREVSEEVSWSFAKGADLLALRIRRLAEIHDVPMVEDPKLARSLYREVKVGRTVPLHFYRAVAEVLAYVYRLKRGVRARKPKSTNSKKRKEKKGQTKQVQIR